MGNQEAEAIDTTCLLRPYGEWPRCRRAAEKGDELSPPQMIEPHLPHRFEGRTGILPKMASGSQGACDPLSQCAGRPTECLLLALGG